MQQTIPSTYQSNSRHELTHRGMGAAASGTALVATAALKLGGQIFGSIFGSNEREKQRDFVRVNRRLQVLQATIEADAARIQRSDISVEEARAILENNGEVRATEARVQYRALYEDKGIPSADAQLGANFAALRLQSVWIDLASKTILADNVPLVVGGVAGVSLSAYMIYKIAQNVNKTDPQDATQSNA